jgi:hypothetical protein
VLIRISTPLLSMPQSTIGGRDSRVNRGVGDPFASVGPKRYRSLAGYGLCVAVLA